MSRLLATECARALRMLQQAVGTAAKVVGRKSSAAGYDAEVLRDDASPVPVRLRAWEAGSQGEPDTVWVLRKPSRSALEQLRKSGQNYVALSGAVRLVANGLFIDRSDLKPLPSRPQPLRQVDPFSDRNSLVARTLLGEPGRRWGVREIAESAGVSAATASLVVRALASRGTVDFKRQGRSAEFWVANPEHLVRRWVGAYSWERNASVALAAPIGDPQRFLRRLPHALAGSRWALTMHAGASLVAPHATWERVHVYVSASDIDDLYEIAEREDWAPAEDGRLVLMKPYYKHSAWHGLRTVNDLPVVSDLQLVLDLWHYPLRGMEQAEHILNTTFPGR